MLRRKVCLAQPRLETLENREQPGSLLSAGLDASLLTDAFIGQDLTPVARLMQSAKPADAASEDVVTTPRIQSELPINPAVSAQATEPGLEETLGLFSQQANPSMTMGGGMERPPAVYGSRGPNLLWYGGDFNGVNGLSNEKGVGTLDGRTYDDMRIRAGFSPIDCVFSRNAMNFTGAVAAADVTILGPGLATANVANGGLPVAFNSAGAAATKTFIAPSGFAGFDQYDIKVCGLGITLSQGHYYVNVRPIMAGAPASGRSFLLTTSGTNAKGSPINNDDSWFTSPPTSFNVVWGPARTQLALPSADFSQGLCSAPTC